MLERIREGAQGPWAMIIIGLIVLSFVFAGVGSYLTTSAPTAVASVNGEDIDANELERAYQTRRSQVESQFGEGITALFSDPSYLASFRKDVLDGMIDDLLLQQHAEELGLRVSDQQVREAILAMPEFQLGGVFDNDRYVALLRQAGYQPASFSDYVRRQMTKDQLTRNLLSTEFSFDNDAESLAMLERQMRSGQYFTVDSDLFADQVTVSEEEAKIFYDANLSNFDTEEKVDLAYVELKASDLTDDFTPSDDEISQYYQDNINAYTTEEVREVSHILVEFGDDEAAAKSKIEEIKQRLDDGEDFAVLAESESEDIFSAENGGSLGEISADMMGEAFDSAAFGLANVGDVSDVVETEFGYHLIKADLITPQSIVTLEEATNDISETLAQDAALEKFYELQSSMEQLAFEIPETLEDVAGALNTTIQTTGLFTRNAAPDLFDRGDLLAEAFSDTLLVEELNSEVIQLDDDHVIVMRVNQYEPQRTMAFSEVSSEILADLTEQQTQEQAKQWAQTLLESLGNESELTALMDEKRILWEDAAMITRYSTDIDGPLRDALFTLSLNEADNAKLVEIGNDKIGVIKLVEVVSAEKPDADTITQFKQRLASQSSQANLKQYVESLKSKADIQVINPVSE